MVSIRNWSIKTKLILLAVVSVGVALAVSSAGLSLNEIYTMRAVKMEALQTQAGMLAFNSTGVLSFRDIPAAKQLLSSLQAQPTVEFACLYDANDQVLATYPEQTRHHAAAQGAARLRMPLHRPGPGRGLPPGRRSRRAGGGPLYPRQHRRPGPRAGRLHQDRRDGGPAGLECRRLAGRAPATKHLRAYPPACPNRLHDHLPGRLLDPRPAAVQGRAGNALRRVQPHVGSRRFLGQGPEEGARRAGGAGGGADRRAARGNRPPRQDPGGTGPGQGDRRGGQRRQEPLPGQHEPRNPHAPERHHRLHRPAAQGTATRTTRPSAKTTWKSSSPAAGTSSPC